MTVSAADDIILDAGSDIVLDAGGDDLRLKVSGTEYAKFNNSSSNLNIFSSIQDKSIKFIGNDNGTEITALTLNMADGGDANFLGTVTSPTFLGDLNGTINTATTGTTQTAGDNSTKIATTAYADAAAAAVPIGNYLPLAGGTMNASANINMNSGSLSSVDYIDFGIGQLNGVSTSNLILKSLGDITYNVDSNNNGNSSHIFQESGSELMRIRYDGNVGINTTSPVVRLHVQGNNIATRTTTTAQSVLRLVRDVVDTAFPSTKDSAVDFMLSRQQTINNNLPYTRLDIRLAGTTDSSTPSLDVMSLLHNGNVGIGRTNPAVPLDVEGKIRSNDSSSNDYFEIFCDGSGSGDSYIENTSNNIQIKSAYATSFSTSGSAAMFIDYNQNVGIGETSPQAKLDIYDTFTKTAANPNTVEVFHTGSVSSNNIYPVAGLFTQRVSGSANVFATGLVGVAEKLGDYGYIARGVQGIGKLSGNITVNNADMQYMGVEGRIEMEGSNSVNLDDRAYSFYGTAEIDSGSHLKEYHGLYLNTPTNNGTILNKYGVSQVDANSKIYFAGNVGIGTTTPLAKLDIQGTQGQLFSVTDDLSGSIFAVSDISGVPIFDVNSSGVSYFDGNVGIGETNPSCELHVKGDSSSGNLPTVKVESTGSISYLKFFNSSTGTGSSDGTYIGMNGGTTYFINKEAGNLYLGTGDAINLTLQNGGNVGIGVTGPTAKLTLADHTTAAGGIKFRTASSAVSLYSASSGNLNSIGSINSNSRFRLPGGNAVADPDYGFSNATAGTGFSLAGQDITFVTGGAEQMRLDNDGNLGIGITTNTTIPLHVNQTGSGTVIKAQGIGATIEIQSGSAGNATLYQRPNVTGDKEAEFRCTLGSTYGWSWKDDNATAASRVKFMKLDQNPGTLTVKGDVVAYGSPSDKKIKRKY